MIVSYPSSGYSILTETPILAKSIRGLWIMCKQKSYQDSVGAFDAVSITIDDIEVVRNLAVYPYIPRIIGEKHTVNNVVIATQNICVDRRFVQLKLDLNVNHSEIRISALPTNKYVVVIEYSEDEVLEESFDFIENTVFRLNNSSPIGGILNPVIVTGNETYNVSLDDNPTKVFATSLKAYNGMWLPQTNTDSYDIELLSSNLIMPRGFDFQTIDTTKINSQNNNTGWRKLSYTFDNVADRNIGVKFNNCGISERDIILSFSYKKFKK